MVVVCHLGSSAERQCYGRKSAEVGLQERRHCVYL